MTGLDLGRWMTGLLVLSWMKRFDLVLAEYPLSVIAAKSAGPVIGTTGRCGAEGRFTSRDGRAGVWQRLWQPTGSPNLMVIPWSPGALIQRSSPVKNIPVV